MLLGLWSLWAKRDAVGNAKRFPRQVPRFAAGELSTNPQPCKRFRCDSSFGPGAPSPWESVERRAGFSWRARTVAGAFEPAFLQGGVS